MRNQDRFSLLSMLLLLALVCGCGESAHDAMIRVAKERAATKQREAAEEAEAAKKAGTNPAEPAANPDPATPPANDQAPSTPNPTAVVTAPAATPTQSSESSSEAAEKPKSKIQHPAQADFDITKSYSLYTLRDEAPTMTYEQHWSRQLKVFQKIAEGLKEAAEDQEPIGDIKDASGKLLLSWRVAILPYIGHAPLYRQFRLDEPWDSEYNKQLSYCVPTEFLDAMEYSNESPILAIQGPHAALGDDRVFRLDRFTDGPQNTLFLVDVGRTVKIPWTKPEDITVNEAKDLRNLFISRWKGSIVGMTASGEIVRFADSASKQEKWAAMSVDGNDGPSESFYEKLNLKSPMVSTQLAATEPTPESMNANPNGENPISGDTAANSLNISGLLELSASAPASDFFAPLPKVRFPIPRPSEVKEAQETLRKIYGKQVQEMQTPEEKLRFAEETYTQAIELVNDPAGGYATLMLIRNMALGAGDFNLMFKATNTMVERYELEPFAERRRTVEEFAKFARLPGKVKPRPGDAGLVTLHLVRQAVHDDDFTTARMLASVLNQLANSGVPGLESRQIIQLRSMLDRTDKEFQNAEQAISALATNPDDDKAAYLSGCYLCFVKGDWREGMPLIARGKGRYADVVSRELSVQPRLNEYLAIADEWYDIGSKETDTIRREAALGRAALWYSHLAPHVTGTLSKLQLNVRQKELTSLPPSLSSVLATLLQKLGGGSTTAQASAQDG